MIKAMYILGAVDGTLPLDQSKLTGDLSTDKKSTYIQGLVAGRVVSLDENGNVQLASDGDTDFGLLTVDADGYDFQNIPALASGKVAALIGGVVAITDQVVETDIKPRDLLYIGTGDNKGLLTKTKPSDTSVPVATARTANNASDKSVTIKMN
jgi:hypothetical protein